MKNRKYDSEIEHQDDFNSVAFVFLERFEALVEAVDENTEVQKKILKVFNDQYSLLKSGKRG